MAGCSDRDERKTPYFIPKTAPATAEGVARLREEFYASVQRARPKAGDPRHALQTAVDLLDKVEAGGSVAYGECAAARDGLKALLAAQRGGKSAGVQR